MNYKKVVLDTYALFAYFNKENGFYLTRELLVSAETSSDQVYLHRINWGEIYYKTYKQKSKNDAKETISRVDKLAIIVEDICNKSFIESVAIIKSKNAVSYADAFAIALALELKAPLVTGDPEITKAAKNLPALKLLWK
jgi:predicted nucleic acid-binding protein